MKTAISAAKKFENRYNGDLANGPGNFAARVLTLAAKTGKFEGGKISEAVSAKIKETETAAREKRKNLNFTKRWRRFGNLSLSATGTSI